MNASKLVLYSYGVVAANKPLTTNTIEVTPMETVSMSNGELTDNLNSSNTKGKDADGSSFETTVKSAATVTARWLPFSSNRKTSPDVRRGEKVAIWKFADADKYYWSELEYEAKLRKLETVIYSFSATEDEKEESTSETTYFLEISTHTKMIHLHTSVSNGEPFGYDIMLNTKDGTFQLRDTIENMIFLDSGSKRIVLKNAAESYFDLFAEDLFVNIVGNMSTKIGGNRSTVIEGNCSTTIGGNRTMVVEGDYDLTANGSYKTTTPTADFMTPMLSTSEQFKTGANATIGAALIVSQGMTTGSGGGPGTLTISGNLDLDGSIQCSGGAVFSSNVTAPNI